MHQSGIQSATSISKKVRLFVALFAMSVLVEGSSQRLCAQLVHVSVWSSAMDHSLETNLMFKSQGHTNAAANIQIFDSLPAQQIAYIGRRTPPTQTSSLTASENDKPVDEEADTLIVNPLRAGAETIISSSGRNTDFILISQLTRVIEPKAFRIAAEVTGGNDIEPLAFLNPDGSYALLTVNRAQTAVSLNTFWQNRILTYTQAASSIAFFKWNPKTPVVVLELEKEQPLASEGAFALAARCADGTKVGIDLSCASQHASCSVSPVYFECDSRVANVILTVRSAQDGVDDISTSQITITAVPDAGENTILTCILNRRGDYQKSLPGVCEN